MTIDTTITLFRNAERALMTSTVTIVRNVGEPSFNTTTGVLVQGTDPVYSGDALIRSNMWEGSDVQAGQQEVRIRGVKIKLPTDTLVRYDDIVTVTASPDARMVGKVFRVTDVMVDDWQISCSTICEEVVVGSPESGS